MLKNLVSMKINTWLFWFASWTTLFWIEFKQKKFYIGTICDSYKMGIQSAEEKDSHLSINGEFPVQYASSSVTFSVKKLHLELNERI